MLPNWVTQPKHMPWLRIKPATFSFAGPFLTNWATPVRAECTHILTERWCCCWSYCFPNALSNSPFCLFFFLPHSHGPIWWWSHHAHFKPTSSPTLHLQEVQKIQANSGATAPGPSDWSRGYMWPTIPFLTPRRKDGLFPFWIMNGRNVSGRLFSN